jgi:multiple antibiotic resistance protein
VSRRAERQEGEGTWKRSSALRPPDKLMADAIKVFLLTLSALFPIVDPLAGSPLFLAMTLEYSPQTRRALAWRVSLNSLLLMVGSYFVGAHVLNFFGVSLPVVQVGGGLVVASMGWGMLLEKEQSHETARNNLQCSDALHSAFYPLTLPLTVGPGSISVAVTLGANSTRRYGFHVTIIVAAVLAMAAVAITVLLCYGLSDQLARAIGKTGMIVVVRLSSFLLVCIGVQIMWNGISALMSSLHI